MYHVKNEERPTALLAQSKSLWKTKFVQLWTVTFSVFDSYNYHFCVKESAEESQWT